MNTYLQGDCRKILPTIEPESVNCIITSPPYYKSGWENFGVSTENGLISEEQTIDEYISNLIDVFQKCYTVLIENGVLFVVFNEFHQINEPLKGIVSFFVSRMLTETEYKLQNVYQWFHTLDTGDFEYIFMFVKNMNYTISMDNFQLPFAWNVELETYDDRYNYNVVPQTIIKDLILHTITKDSSGVVLDPFMGTGSVAIAASECNCNFIGIEISDAIMKFAKYRIESSILPKCRTCKHVPKFSSTYDLQLCSKKNVLVLEACYCEDYAKSE